MISFSRLCLATPAPDALYNRSPESYGEFITALPVVSLLTQSFSKLTSTTRIISVRWVNVLWELPLINISTTFMNGIIESNDSPRHRSSQQYSTASLDEEDDGFDFLTTGGRLAGRKLEEEDEDF